MSRGCYEENCLRGIRAVSCTVVAAVLGASSLSLRVQRTLDRLRRLDGRSFHGRRSFMVRYVDAACLLLSQLCLCWMVHWSLSVYRISPPNLHQHQSAGDVQQLYLAVRPSVRPRSCRIIQLRPVSNFFYIGAFYRFKKYCSIC